MHLKCEEKVNILVNYLRQEFKWRFKFGKFDNDDTQPLRGHFRVKRFGYKWLWTSQRFLCGRKLHLWPKLHLYNPSDFKVKESKRLFSSEIDISLPLLLRITVKGIPLNFLSWFSLGVSLPIGESWRLLLSHESIAWAWAFFALFPVESDFSVALRAVCLALKDLKALRNAEKSALGRSNGVLVNSDLVLMKILACRIRTLKSSSSSESSSCSIRTGYAPFLLSSSIILNAFTIESKAEPSLWTCLSGWYAKSKRLKFFLTSQKGLQS